MFLDWDFSAVEDFVQAANSTSISPPFPTWLTIPLTADALMHRIWRELLLRCGGGVPNMLLTCDVVQVAHMMVALRDMELDPIMQAILHQMAVPRPLARMYIAEKRGGRVLVPVHMLAPPFAGMLQLLQ